MQCNFVHDAKFRAVRENFTHARISSASHFRTFCIFSNFTPDVILMSSYVYVIPLLLSTI